MVKGNRRENQKVRGAQRTREADAMEEYERRDSKEKALTARQVRDMGEVRGDGIPMIERPCFYFHNGVEGFVEPYHRIS